jgi:hypothetical protein
MAQLVGTLTFDNILKVVDGAVGLVHIIQTRDLDEPPNIMREQRVSDDPMG